MQFHSYVPGQPTFWKGSRNKFIDDVLAGRLSMPEQLFWPGSDGVRYRYECVPPLLEKAWRLIDRPYYNVFPVIESLCNKTRLDVRWDQVAFPFSPLLFRFGVGREPHRLSSALVFTVPPPNCPGFDYGQIPAYDTSWASNGHEDVEWDCRPRFVVDTSDCCDSAKQSATFVLSRNLVCVGQFVKDDGYETNIWACRAGDWNETVEQTLNEGTCNERGNPVSSDNDKAADFLSRLAVFAALVGRGEDLITPEILSRDRQRYEDAEEAERRWIEARAAKINGRGFAFGKTLQERSDASPHWRNPHMALFWTGEGRSKPVLKLRSGCVVTSTHLSKIPTGFLGDAENIDEPSVSTLVYRVPVPKRLRFLVMKRDQYRCQICGLTQRDGVKLEIDHKVPVARGGRTIESNLWTLCHPCNNGKTDSYL
jgi:hypothetical protein